MSDRVDEKHETESALANEPTPILPVDPSKIVARVIEKAKALGKKLRCTPGFPMKISAYDLIALLRDCNENRSGEIYRNMKKNAVHDPIVNWFNAVEITKVSGERERDGPFVDGFQSIELINMLVGNEPLLLEFKAMCTNVVVHAAAGDRNLARAIDAIDDRFAAGEVGSNDPLNLFRDTVHQEQGRSDRPSNSMLSPPAPTAIENDIEEATRAVAAIDIDADERRAQARILFEAKLELVRRQMQRDDDEHRMKLCCMASAAYLNDMKTAMDISAAFVPNDDRARIAKSSNEANYSSWVKDHCERMTIYVKSRVEGPQQLLLTGSSSNLSAPQVETPPTEVPETEVVAPPNRVIRIEQFIIPGKTKAWVAANKGPIGKKVAAIYRAERKREPIIHEEMNVAGHLMQIKTYYEGDEEIIVRGIQAYADAQTKKEADNAAKAARKAEREARHKN